MTKQELDDLKTEAVIKIFSDRDVGERFFSLVSRLWRHPADSILAIYMQHSDAKCVAGKRAFEALGYSLREGEEPIYIYNTVIRRSAEGGFYSEIVPVQVYDIKQFDGEQKKVAETEESTKWVSGDDSQMSTVGMGEAIGIAEACEEVGVPVMEVDRLPGSVSYYPSFYDEEEKAIVVTKGLSNGHKQSAIALGLIEFLLSDDAGTVLWSKEDQVILRRYREEVKLLSLFCIEKNLGIESMVSSPLIIVSNVTASCRETHERVILISIICGLVQYVLKHLSGRVLTVDETTIINSLMTSSDRNELMNIYKYLTKQQGVDERTGRTIEGVFRMLEELDDKGIKRIYDTRMKRQLFSYPAFRVKNVEVKE